MPRAYLRLDPAFDERKHAYPDGAYAALVATFCLAEHQPERGRFRSADYLARLLGRRGKWVKYLLEMGDVVETSDGRAYVDGWDEWQEGDVTVRERMARLRDRRNKGRNDVTEPSSLPAIAVAQGGSGGVSGGKDGASDAPKPRTQRQVAHQWLTDHGAAVPTGWALKTLDELVKVFGVKSVVASWESAGSEVRTSNQYVRHAERELAPTAPTRITKYLEHAPKEVSNAFDR